MTSVSNSFLSLTNKNNNLSPALSQGVKFKKYQKKFKKNLEKPLKKDLFKEGLFKEGFENIQEMGNNLNLSPNGLTEQSINIIENNNYSSSQQQTVANLQQEYKTTLNEYENLIAQISQTEENYLNRINPNNPYLGKNVCLTNGACGYVTQQGVFKLYPTNDASIYNSTAGYNGCPNTAYEQINGDGDVKTVGSTISSNPPLIVGTPMESGQSCGNEGTNVFVNSMINNPTTTYEGCYADNITSPLMTFIGGSPNGSSSNGSFTYEQCQSAAINEGYQYFALQNVNTSNSQGYCAVSNSQTNATSLGEGMVLNGQTVLWSSNTSSNSGYTALLTNVGALSVYNSAGTSMFSTPNSTAQPSNYLGCYGDKSNRAMTMYNKGSQLYNYSQCQQIAQQNNAIYFGLQNSTSGSNAQCAISSNLSQTTEYGAAGNCTQISDGTWSGGGWSNAVYNTTAPNSNYFLVLQDNGNMCIYRGSNPNDNQGTIWCSNTTGLQQQANPAYAASNGKYGQNWITSGSTLAAGDFVGSTNGNMALIMQTDGNLVLCTFSLISNCQKMTNGNMGGGIGANALYNIGDVGLQSLMGQLSYIDQNTDSHPYPSTNIQYSNTYTEMPGTDSSGNDITGTAYDNATVETCQTTCNNNPDCAGFAFKNNSCYPKTSGMYPTGSSQLNSSVNLYIRGKMPITTPIGVSKQVNNTSSVTYNNYIPGGSLDNNYGLTTVINTQKQQLLQLQTKLNALSMEITGLTNKFQTGSQQAETQVQTNVKGIDKYVNKIKKTNNKITNFDNNVEQILNDSDIVVLQKNYDYLFWSILAAGTVLIAMNTIKM